MSISTVLLDLDGVIRHFDRGHAASVEEQYGLEPGVLAAAGFEPALMQQLITGRIKRSEWGDQVGRQVGSVDAGRAWLTDIGAVDRHMLAEVDRIRRAGTTVAILTNGADTIPAEMLTLGLVDHFDQIFNTAEIGFAKIDPRSFEYACTALGVEPAAVFFTDDSKSNLPAAIGLGMTARHFEGIELFRQHLDELGIEH
ncbi:MAG: HAD-IA family hydrolase [Acidimicrobiales bacterium]